MADAQFNMHSFLGEQSSYLNRQYTAIENGKAAMEEREVKRAEEAVKEDSFLGLTLSEKLAELGLGDRVVQQLGDTALGMLKDLVDPITDYLEKYENIFDQSAYYNEMQAMGKQMWQAKMALSEDAASRDAGQRFVLDM